MDKNKYIHTCEGSEVTIIIPFVRSQNMDRLIEQIHSRAGLGHFDIRARRDVNGLGHIWMIDRLIRESTTPYVAFIADDTEPQPDFLVSALMSAKERFSGGVGLVAFSDTTGRSLACHWLMHKDLLDKIGGYALQPCYFHSCSDVELTERAKSLNLFHYDDTAVVVHNHPYLDPNVKKDEYNKEVMDSPMLAADMQKLEERRKLNWPTVSGKVNMWKEYHNGHIKISKKAKGAVKMPKMKAKVVLGMPSMDTLYTLTSMNFTRMTLDILLNGYEPVIVNPIMSQIDVARNFIVKAALDLNADYVLFVDSDMTFPAHAAIRLINKDVDIVGCNAVKRVHPYAPIQKVDVDGKPLDFNATGLVELKQIGSGFLLVKTQVFRDMSAPWFSFSYDGLSWVSEDYRFCQAAKEKGYKTWCDMELSREIGHIGPRPWKIGDVPQPPESSDDAKKPESSDDVKKLESPDTSTIQA